MRIWLLRFRCTPEELRDVVSRLSDWMDNSSPLCSVYRALMACHLVALDKSPGVRPVGIGETLRRALAKLVMRAYEYQAKTVCGNLQLCAGLESGIEGATHALGQRKIDLVKRIRRDEEEAVNSDEEEERGGVAGLLNNLTIDMVGTEEEAAEHLEAALGMEVEEDGGSEGEEGGDGTQRALGAL